MIVWPDTDRARRVPMERLTMQRGDRSVTSAGGRMGDPLDRPIRLVREDVLGGYASPEQAGGGLQCQGRGGRDLDPLPAPGRTATQDQFLHAVPLMVGLKVMRFGEPHAWARSAGSAHTTG